MVPFVQQSWALVLSPTAASLLLLEKKISYLDLPVQEGKGTEVLEMVLEQSRI